MKEKMNEISVLEYQIRRYRTLGKGTMCQTLNAKLQKLIKEQAAA